MWFFIRKIVEDKNCLLNKEWFNPYPNLPQIRFPLVNTYLLHQLNAGLEIHTEIHEDPVDTFFLVLFLLKNEHVMVEKLLQLLVGEVDAKLLESVVLIFFF